jgi:hypothetical protein
MPRGNRPTHVVQAKTGRTNEQGKHIYIIVGNAWVNDEGISLKLETLPVNFDGSLYLAERRE